MGFRDRSLLGGVGACAALYAVVVLGFVATSPDLRLRCLLIDEVPRDHGVQIRDTPGLVVSGPRPSPGDLLLKIGDHPTTNFFDFANRLIELRSEATPPGGLIDAGTDLAELSPMDLPWLVEENQIGRRWVRVVFQRVGEERAVFTWLLVQSVPLGDVLLTFVWLMFQLLICGVAAMACWHRPFDRTATLFFAMCIVTLGAFIGGYHWHVIAGNLWLSLPMIAFTAVLPVVTLHFFLVYPRTKAPLNRWPRLILALLYAPPVLAIVGVAVMVLNARFLTLGTTEAIRTEHLEHALGLLRAGVYVYLGIGAVCFALTLAALVDSQLTTRNAVEHLQVKWILRAGLIAAVPVSYTLYVAWVDRVAFALGHARVVLFVASIALMLAYAIGIVRHKLMLVDQILGKGVWYWTASMALTASFSLIVAGGSLAAQLAGVSLSLQQSLATAAVIGLAVPLLLGVRDFAQQTIDRRFFREKYQLDRTLQRMNTAMSSLGDQESLTRMMLGSCSDVLRVERSALYLRDGAAGQFRLAAVQSDRPQPIHFKADETFLETLSQQGTLQRVEVQTRSEMNSVQNDLRILHADLVHGIESGDGIEGLVILGEKKGGGVYTAEDLTYLHALAQITNVALQTARIRQQMERINDELQRKSERLNDQGRQISILQAELMAANTAEEPVADATERPPETVEFRRDALRGHSPAILRVLETARKVASSESTVLIRGESGTGKELLAQVLHDNSPRRDGPMVRVNCAALSAGLLESELFGHVKGAFTGAHKDRVGRFEAANGGTLFLDEIGDISLETQVKLLRVLQERSFEPVGGSRTVHVDVRLVTATHQDLPKLITQGRFREDLYYRLNVITMMLPPLRERREDILELSLYFLARASARLQKRVTHLDEEAIAALENAAWAGNIRELENVIERAVVLCDGDKITLRELPAELSGGGRTWPRHVVEAKPIVTAPDTSTDEMLGRRPFIAAPIVPPPVAPEQPGEREALLEALRQCGGNKAKAARLLGVPRSTLFSRLKKYGIE